MGNAITTYVLQFFIISDNDCNVSTVIITNAAYHTRALYRVIRIMIIPLLSDAHLSATVRYMLPPELMKRQKYKHGPITNVLHYYFQLLL